jgi:hypothetical protein
MRAARLRNAETNNPERAAQAREIWRRHTEQPKAILDLVVVKHQDGRTSEPEAGLKRRVLAYNERLFLAEHEMVVADSCLSCFTW